MEYPINSYPLSLLNLIEIEKKLVVPAYQRGYEWNEDNLEDFLHSIIGGYMEHHQVFFGTIQLDDKDDIKEIVDGQQRMTTMMLFINILEIIIQDFTYANKEAIDYRNVRNANADFAEVFDFYETKQILINEAQKDEIVKNSKNKYVLNTKLLYLVYRTTCNENEIDEVKCAKLILEYILDNIYFIVLETKKIPLPEIVKIFNTINRTGLALNNSDAFKLQFYEYLRKYIENSNVDYMESINECYNLVDDYNHRNEQNKINMVDILDVYKHCICAKYSLGYDNLAKSNDLFFEDLFKNPESYKDLLDFYEFKRLVILYIDLFDRIQSANISCNEYELLSANLIESTRYSKYRTIPYISAFFSLQDYSLDKEIAYSLAMQDLRAAVNYYIVNTVTYDRQINAVHTFTCNSIFAYLSKCIPLSRNLKNDIWRNPNDKNDRYSSLNWFVERVEKDLYTIQKRANIICQISSMIEEINNINSDSISDKVQVVRKKLFSWDTTKYDLEHIYPQSGFATLKPKKLEATYNGIGNIMVLEREINRSIQDLPPLKKADRYIDSNYYSAKCVMDIITKRKTWGKDEVFERRDREIERLIKYLSIENGDVIYRDYIIRNHTS